MIIRVHPAALVAAALLVTGVGLHAAGNGSVAVQVPYTGHLDDDGVAVSIATSMSFKIFDDATAGTALSEDVILVTPVAGLFSVVLGTGTDTLTTSELDAAELWLEVAVAGTTIGARQRIYAATQAVRADAASDFTVRGVLTATGGANVTGGLTADTATIDDLTLPGGATFEQGGCASFIDSVGGASTVCGSTTSGLAITAAPTRAVKILMGTESVVFGEANTSFSGSLSVSDDIDFQGGGGDITDVTSLRFSVPGGTAGSGNLTAKFDTIGTCTSADHGRIRVKPTLISPTTDGLCMCIRKAGVYEEWCVHP
jgi:hypothetical protein